MAPFIDWDALFVPTVHLGEIVLRGTFVYFVLFGLLRLLRRGAGDIGLSDLLVVVLIADAAQNAMASEYRSITEGAVLVATIVGWDFLLDWLSFNVPATTRFLRPAPLLLIKNGQLQRRNMKRQMIEEEELLSQLREQGVERFEDVRECFLEGNGHVSVVKRKG
jgi:uncharacterized membrane protein YcaP (DUF421 family)